MANIDVESSIRILLVEDDIDSAEALLTMLEKRRISVVSTESAERALEIFNPADFDIIVSDIRLGGMSGVALLRAIRKDHADFPVILLTGYDSLDSAVEAVRLGAQDYILKPLESIDNLVIPVKKAIRTHRLQLQNNQLQKDLSASEALFRAVLSSSVDIIYKYSIKNGRLEYVSPSSETILGYTPEEMKQLTFSDLVNKEDKERVAEFFKEKSVAKMSSGFACQECFIRKQNGDYVLLSFRQLAQRDETGRIISFIGNARDVTREREIENKNREIRDIIAKSKRIESLGVLAGGVAHDLNNLLGSMIVMPDLILEDIRKMDEREELSRMAGDVAMIKKSSIRAAAIIKNLVMMSRRKSRDMYPLNINEVIRDFIDSSEFVMRSTDRTGICLSLALEDEVKPVMGIESQLMQVVMNLVMNAYDALDELGEIEVKSREQVLEEEFCGYEVIGPGTYSVITVSDNGPGMRPDQLEHIFEPFYTQKKATSSSGTGLGLAVTHGIIKDHLGYVDVQSEPGKGAKFEVYLPVTDQLVRQEDEVDINLVGSGRILIVDDMHDQLLMAERILTSYGYVVDVAVKGEQAMEEFKSLKKSESSPYDLVILDMVLEEGFDGMDVMREIKQIVPGQRIIIASAFNHADRIKEAERLGLEQFIAKPYTMEELGMAVKKALSGDETRNQPVLVSDE